MNKLFSKIVDKLNKNFSNADKDYEKRLLNELVSRRWLTKDFVKVSKVDPFNVVHWDNEHYILYISDGYTNDNGSIIVSNATGEFKVVGNEYHPLNSIIISYAEDLYDKLIKNNLLPPCGFIKELVFHWYLE